MLFKFEKKLKKELSHALDSEKPNAWNNIENSLSTSIIKNDAPTDMIHQNKKGKSTSNWMLRPVRIAVIALVFVFTSVSVLAIANPDVRDFLMSAFSNNADKINGEFVGIKSKSNGFTLTVDGVVPQANSFYLFFTLTDTENRLKNNVMNLQDWSFNVDGNTGWSAYHVREIKNGEPTYMVFSLADAKKLSGKKNIDFSIKSLKLDTPKSTTVDVALGQKDFIPVKGYKINRIQASDGYLNLYIDSDTDNMDFIIDSIKIINKTNGKEYNFIGEYASQDNDSSIYKAKKVSENIGSSINPDDYIIRITFLENVKIDPPLHVQFTADFNNKVVAEIKPKNMYITESYGGSIIKSKLLKVTANQLCVNLEFEKPKPLPQETQTAVKIENASDTKKYEDPIFASVNEPVETRNVSLIYEDGTQVRTVLMNTEIENSQLVSRSILLKEPLDLSRRPTLHIGDISIALYK